MANDYLVHYGVIGMHWGIRRYQPYDVVPRGSGEGGKEIGVAAKKNKEIARSNVKTAWKNTNIDKFNNKNTDLTQEAKKQIILAREALGKEYVSELLKVRYVHSITSDANWSHSGDKISPAKIFKRFTASNDTYRELMKMVEGKPFITGQEYDDIMKLFKKDQFKFHGEVAQD